MRKVISAMQISLDGFIEGPEGAIDWVESWEDTFDILSEVDTFVLGGGMYHGYESYWTNIYNNPQYVSPFTGLPATEGEIAYAKFAMKTPHYLLTNSITSVNMDSVSIINDLDTVHQLKKLPGKSIHVIGGAKTVCSVLNAGLIDEIRLTIHPVILGGGKSLFQNVELRKYLNFVESQNLSSGKLGVVYKVKP